MNFNIWDNIGTVIGAVGIAIVSTMIGFGKGAAKLSKDLTTVDEESGKRWLYKTQREEIEDCKKEIKLLKLEHKDCERRLDEQDELISRLNLRIIDLQTGGFE